MQIVSETRVMHMHLTFSPWLREMNYTLLTDKYDGHRKHGGFVLIPNYVKLEL